MTELIITRGLPASGKTTFARHLVDSRPTGSIIRLNRDDLRAMCLTSGYGQTEYRSEQLITQIQHGPITSLLKSGVDVIVDDTNLRARVVRTLAQLAVRAGADWQCEDEFLQVPVEECIRRDAARSNPVGEDVIRKMWRKYFAHGQTLPVPVLDEETVTGRPYVTLPDKPLAILCDLDGTVALNGTRNPYDTSRYHEDSPNVNVIDAVRSEMRNGHHVLFCSGRSSEFRSVTFDWIREHVTPEGWESRWRLLMRPAGDTRNDAIIKLELFDEHIRDHYDVRRVYDDRDRVIAAWRNLGLTVFQVNYGDF